MSVGVRADAVRDLRDQLDERLEDGATKASTTWPRAFGLTRAGASAWRGAQALKN